MAVISRYFFRTLLIDSGGIWLRPAAFIALFLSLTACSGNTGDSANSPAKSVQQPAETTAPAAELAELTPERMGQWTRNCALCHVRGEGGAPVIGDREAWASRLAQGEELLLQHTVEGLNNMPPLGYCMDCETADFLALIRFMGGDA